MKESLNKKALSHIASEQWLKRITNSNNSNEYGPVKYFSTVESEHNVVKVCVCLLQ